MPDRRDTDRELATLLSELEETLTALRGTLDEGDGRVGHAGQDRRRDADWRNRPAFPRPPSVRELLRFTEQQTIPTLVAILEVNIRLLRFAAAALRAVDPERSATGADDSTAVGRALDAGGQLSTDRLASGLSDLQDALSGTDAPNPEARQLLEEAERLSEEVRERVRAREEARVDSAVTDAGAPGRSSGEATGPVHIEVEEATDDENGVQSEGDDAVSAADDGTVSADDEMESADDESGSGVNVDAELDSIREEVRGEENVGDAARTSDSGGDEGTNDDDDAEADAADE